MIIQRKGKMEKDKSNINYNVLEDDENDEDKVSEQIGPSLPPKPNTEILVNPISSFVKGGIGLMVPATLDMLLAFFTKYWATWANPSRGESGGYGLWVTWNCWEQVRDTSSAENKMYGDNKPRIPRKMCEERWVDASFPAWYVATQAMATLAMAGMAASFCMLLIYIFTPGQRTKRMISAIISVGYASALFLLVTLCVFGAKAAEEIEDILKVEEWTFSWSFSMACTAFVMNAISASILITENNRQRWPHDYKFNQQRDNPLPTHMAGELVLSDDESYVKVSDLKIGPPPATNAARHKGKKTEHLYEVITANDVRMAHYEIKHLRRAANFDTSS